ncbi:bifunctional class I SAM-dependent methyltransferase/N-acetyltransferase [Micromonospora sp. KC723]|uniref:bifunctional class I SAM-dependent methyltransferase/N-acetyltransferase n=1 Tax=Micromonospora sp. KC723 TaxID=2530381 RepID=UPI00104A3D8C|nr:bifunctional class I SAM-dependent methyltransferase/N-acetyltransferase [Micromonospora sp. KC723]TDB72844.1 GNAT family N-acetyltransferase [Micromonospora sp. KC723]
MHNGLPRQGPGSETTTRRLLALAGPLPEHPRVLDLGCGTGPAALLLAAEAGAQVVAVDLHQPFLDELAAVAAARRITSITTARLSMADLPFPDRSFDLVWAEGSVYNIGFDTALVSWRRLLAPGGALVVTECEWSTDTPSIAARTYWGRHYPLRTRAANIAAAEAAGYTVEGVYELPDNDWFDDYYTLLTERVETAPARPGMAEAVTATREEISLRRRHGTDYRYTGYVLRPVTESPRTHTHEEPYPAMTNRIWHTRLEAGPDDRAAIRRINLAAFPGPLEADLVDALREDRQAWLPWSSWIAEDPNGTPAGFALLTRCHVDDVPALALGPCSVLPEQQRTGAGSAAIRAALDAARAAGENLVLVLGHAPYYPRFGFMPASGYGIRPPFDVPDENMMALVFDPARPVPRGTIRYAAAFGV